MRVNAASWKTNLEGKRALVTGASSGLGRHFAQLLADAGASLVIAARRIEALEAFASDINRAGGSAIAVTLDVTNRQSVAAAVEEAWRSAGPIDIVVNNAGVTVTAPALEHTEDQWDTVIDTNLKGAF